MQALELGGLRLGVVAAIDAGRETRKLSSIDPTPSDARLAGMGKVGASVEGDLAVGYGPLSLVARQSIDNRGHQGTQVDLGVQVPIPVSERLDLSIGASTTWADRKYMQA